MKKIIVAEGSPTIKSVADSLLRQNGYDVVCTSDGLQAWEVVNAEVPDLILAGVELSGISGVELCRQISTNSRTGGVPVVMLVGAKDNVSQDDLKSAGARGKLQKPFSPRDLLNAVTKLIGMGEQGDVIPKKSGDTTGVTSYKANVMSTTKHLNDSKNEVYNLDWSDLNDTGMSNLNPGQEDIINNGKTDDQEIQISNDQFDLETLNSADSDMAAPGKPASDDEDYDWFIGEMKKEVEGGSSEKKSEAQAPAENSKASGETSSSKDSEEMKFEDFGPSNATAIAEKPVQAPLNQAKQENSGHLSDEVISRIADQVTSKLVSALAGSIDRQKIIDAIKSVVK